MFNLSIEGLVWNKTMWVGNTHDKFGMKENERNLHHVLSLFVCLSGGREGRQIMRYIA